MNLNEENPVRNDLLKEQILYYMQESSSLLGLLHVFQNSLYSSQGGKNVVFPPKHSFEPVGMFHLLKSSREMSFIARILGL